MNKNNASPVRRLIGNESGQVLPVVAVMLVALVGMAGLVIDLGRAFYSYKLLQASSDAAALAGAQSLPNTTATSVALSYSSVTGNKNVYSNVHNVTMVSGYPKLECLTTLTAQGLPCTAPTKANAIVVRQQATVPMYFVSLLGEKTLTVQASSTAAMGGGTPSPANLAIIVDTTFSMNSLDSDSSCNDTRLNCALQGVRTLMTKLAPCPPSQSTCGAVTSGNVKNAINKVSLFTFPAVTTATAPNDYNCGASLPKITPYTSPSLPTSATYQVVGFSSDYRASDTASALSTSSNLVVAAGGKSLCSGMQAPGGVGTYYAGVIYAAQAALAATSAPGTQNVMILLSDGNAGTSASNLPGASTKSGIYPSTVNQCAQAVAAAQAATAAGTHVYAVAYGAESAGCGTDTTGITPCQTMQQIASNPAYFYSDYTATGGDNSCVSAAKPISGIPSIFNDLGGGLPSAARLVPDNTP
jgi:Flp pilus assembly protein TadG